MLVLHLLFRGHDAWLKFLLGASHNITHLDQTRTIWAMLLVDLVQPQQPRVAILSTVVDGFFLAVTVRLILKLHEDSGIFGDCEAWQWKCHGCTAWWVCDSNWSDKGMNSYHVIISSRFAKRT